MNDPAGQLVERFRAGDRRALARLITRLDNDPHAVAVLDALGPPARRAGVIGVTGPPGVGKSTLLARMIGRLRDRGRRVAVMAFDPQSPISGGALLGDRLRMGQAAAADPDVFIRSLSSRGSTGGLSASVRSICRLLELFGYDRILVETVGVGQGEMAVLRVADVVMLMVMPGTGDAIQWEKAGLIEVAHVVVINKADRPGVDQVERELREALAAAPPGGNGDWGGADPGGGDPPARPARPILKTVASDDVGVGEVVERLEDILSVPPAVDWHQIRTEILQEAEMLIGQRLRELAEDDAILSQVARLVAHGQRELSWAAEQALARLLPRLAGRNGQ